MSILRKVKMMSILFHGKLVRGDDKKDHLFSKDELGIELGRNFQEYSYFSGYVWRRIPLE